MEYRVAEKERNLDLLERETIITFNEGEKTSDVFTHNKMLQKKLDDLCVRFPNIFKLTKDNKEWGCKSYIIYKKYVKINAPVQRSEQAKEEAKNRLLSMRTEAKLKS